MAVSIPITYHQANRFKTALGLIYNTSNRFVVVLSRVGQSYNLLEKGNLSYAENILSIIQIAATDGWLMQLISEVLVDAEDPDVKQIQQELRPFAVAAAVDPFEVCRLTGSNVMVDRTDLRTYLKAMADPRGKRLLVVKGPRRSGRTHTLQLLSYAEQQRGGFTLVPIDLESFTRVSGAQVANATNATPIQITTKSVHGFTSGNGVYIDGISGNTAANGLWTITALGAKDFTLDRSAGNGAYVSGGIAKLQTPIEAWDIAERLRDLLLLYKELELPEAPTDASWSRWLQTFCNRFQGIMKSREEERRQRIPPPAPHQVWIVIDGFHAVLLGVSAISLIHELANRIYSTLTNFRMVLLGFEDSLPAGVVNHLEEEKILKIGEDQIIEFFGLAFRQMQIPDDVDKVSKILKTVFQEADPTDPDFLAKLGPIASRELAKLESGPS